MATECYKITLDHEEENLEQKTPALTMSIPSSPKLDGLDIIQTTYKKIGDHEIRTDILIPQTPHEGQRPVIIRLHGGGFVCGPFH